MSQNNDCLEGTNIPQDPRKRTKAQGRLTLTFWIDAGDFFVDGSKDVTDILREAVDEARPELEGIKDSLNSYFGFFLGGADEIVARVDIQVSK
jgi:hypothetical protein